MHALDVVKKLMKTNTCAPAAWLFWFKHFALGVSFTQHAHPLRGRAAPSIRTVCTCTEQFAPTAHQSRGIVREVPLLSRCQSAHEMARQVQLH